MAHRAGDQIGSTYDMPELLRIKAQILAAMPRHGRASAISCLTEASNSRASNLRLPWSWRSMMTLALFASRGGQGDQATS